MKFFKNIFVQEILLFALLAFVLLSFCLKTKPWRCGDGHEYSLITKAFLNHLSPDVRIEDIDSRELEIHLNPCKYYHSSIFNDIKNSIIKGFNTTDFYKTSSGKYYGYHFWLYPLYVASIEALIKLFSENPLQSFQIANASLFLIVAAYCLFALHNTSIKKFAAISTFLLGGSLFYLKWTHPEVFITSFLFIGFLGLFTRSYKSSFVCFGLVSTQVISLWLVFITIPLSIFLHYRYRFLDEIKIISKQWWSWTFSLLPFIYIGFYYFNYSKITLIGTSWVDFNLFSFSRLWSFWFDLDQGVFVGAPWLLIVLTVFFIQIKNISKECKFNFIISIAGSLIVCLPLLIKIPIISGHSVFDRYALYAVTPVVAWSGYYIIYIVKNKFILNFIFISAISYNVIFSGPKAKEIYLDHKPWTNFVLDHYAQFYNPEPEIFYQKNIKGKKWIEDPDNPIICLHSDSEGYVRKIMYPLKYADQIASILWEDDIVNENQDFINFNKPSCQVRNWAYLNGKFPSSNKFRENGIDLEPLYEKDFNGIDFTKYGFPSFVKYISGLSSLEEWGRWSDSTKIVIQIKGILPPNFKIKLKVGAYATNIGNITKISVNGLTKEFVIAQAEPQEYILDFVSEELIDPIIEIIPFHPTSPASLKKSEDKRKLGISFYEISWDE